MKFYRMLFCLGLALFAGVAAQAHQAAPQANAAAPPDRVIGEIRTFDLAGKKMAVKADQAGVVNVLLQDSTLYYRIPPGEKSLDKAEKIAATDIHVGDRVFARGSFSPTDKAVVARQVIMMA